MGNLCGGKNSFLKYSCFVIMNSNDTSIDLNNEKTDGGWFLCLFIFFTIFSEFFLYFSDR